ncbi:MAG: hypothetical protein GYA36_18360 [Veillonellaceae bacterium]|nr:hypothetical protein [Veillonellaceae bacterium]
MNITFPTDTEDTIDAIRNAIGRDVIFQTELKYECPTCSGLDPITNNPLDPFCVTCSGHGYIITISGTSVQAHVSWNTEDQTNWVPGGTFIDGDCRVQIKLTAENLDLVNNSHFVIVDDKKLTVNKVTRRGVPQLNRILVDLKLEDNNG